MVALLVLSILQPGVRALGTAKLMSLASWLPLLVVSNALGPVGSGCLVSISSSKVQALAGRCGGLLSSI